MKESLDNQVTEVKFTNRLKTHPVCLTTKGEISIEMEKVINAMPTDEKIKAELILEINENHEIQSKLKKLYETDKEELKKYTKIFGGMRKRMYFCSHLTADLLCKGQPFIQI